MDDSEPLPTGGEAEPPEGRDEPITAILRAGWQEVDRFFEWPPDLFALTSLILQRTGLHRHIVDPRRIWPPERDWDRALEEESRRWYESLSGRGQVGQRM